MTARIRLTERTVIVPESEVVAKREKAQKSDAVKAFANLTPMEQRAALDAITKAKAKRG